MLAIALSLITLGLSFSCPLIKVDLIKVDLNKLFIGLSSSRAQLFNRISHASDQKIVISLCVKMTKILAVV